MTDLSTTEPFTDLRQRFAALAALEEHIGESCGNASHNIRAVLDGSYDPRPDADRVGLDYAPSQPAAHHLPLLDLTADEVDALRVAALSSALDHGSEETLRSALDKLTTTEETPDA